MNTNQTIPNDENVIELIRKRFPKGEIVLGDSSNSEKQIGLVIHHYYWRHFSLIQKDEASGMVGKIDSAVIYEWIDDNYVFSNYATINTSIVSEMELDKSALLQYINANLKEFLGGSYDDLVGEKPVISLSDDAELDWDSPEMLTVNIKAVYSRVISNTEIETAEHIYETMLFKDTDSKKWNRIIADEIEGLKKIISKITYSDSEIEAIKS